MKFSALNPTDAGEIERLFIMTFTDSAGQSEGSTVGGLAAELMRSTAESDLYGFVATNDAQIVGAILFSRMRFEHDICAFILGPVAVSTDHQHQGIGQKLIQVGLDVLKQDGVDMVLTYGDPRFYSKVGFRVISEALVPPPLKLSQPEGWMAQSLIGNQIEPIAGKSRCVEALNKPEYW